MTTTVRFAPPSDDGTFGCVIPADDVNAPRALAAAGDGLPVVLRDPIANQAQFEAFACRVRKADPPTPDRVDPDVAFTMGVHSSARVIMPDGRRVDFMSFHHVVEGAEDDDADRVFPSPLLRVREGQVVHTTLIPSRNTHTIHHHGIEPTPHNDGVGHASFEVANRYTYQWRASSAGSYFYHCHKNTVLHFEMGMYGPLIVDPPEGPGFVRRGMDVVPYDQEVEWIPDDVDPAWHALDHLTGLLACPFDPSQHLLHFDPQYWLLSGIPHPLSRTDPSVAVRCERGERILLRLLNAAYGPTVVTLPFDGEVVNVDGHVLGGPHGQSYSQPFAIRAGQPFELSTAQRYDVLIEPDREGVFTVPFEFRHWIRGTVYGYAETTITVE
jgi:FtsP/CotA-like multicopper oxidase with cupredoxin domain